MLHGIASFVKDSAIYCAYVSQRLVGIWFSVWLIRRKGEFDKPLDKLGRKIRWTGVIVGLLVADVADTIAYPRVIGLLTCLVFLCWPNTAYHVARIFKRARSGDPPLTVEGQQ
jgi:hypothetical protein